jgi:GDPmannose 4,6-dehydratase
LYAFLIAKNYREAYGMFACNGILFNHESPLRGETFVTRKVTRAVARISLGLQEKMYMGNIDSERDWGHARDYVEGMWLMMQQETPDDFVCATGVSHSVRELVNYVFTRLGLHWSEYVKQDEKFLRPEELHDLKGDSSKLISETGWSHDYTFETMLDEMIDYWMNYYKIN